MKSTASGPFAKLIRRHLELQRSLGAVLKDHDSVLADFDRFAAEHFKGIRVVTRPMVEAYLDTTRELKNPTRHAKLTIVRRLCRFLFQLDTANYIPGSGLLPPLRPNFHPHIYSPDDVCNLIQSASQLTPEGSLRPQTYATLIGLLWVSGLRIGEVLRLNLRDVDLKAGVVHVEQTKFFKSRLVPLRPSAINALEQYAELRSKQECSQDEMAPFFLNQHGCRCHHRTVCATFRSLIRGLGLKSLQGRDPRLHDFRHSLATHYLTRLYQQKEDPAAGLPVLSTYLGHVNIACTTVYLHPSLNVLHNAASRFGAYTGQSWRNPQ